MPEIFDNFRSGVLSTGINATATMLASGNYAFLPAVVAPDTLRISLDPAGVNGVPEIAIVTAHVLYATTITVTRGAEQDHGAGPARAHAVDTVWRHSLTEASIHSMLSAADAAIAAARAELADPVGTVRMSIDPTPRPGEVALLGQTIVNAQTLHPELWVLSAVAGWKSGANLVLPNMTERFPVGAGTTVAGAVAGANTHTLTQAELPAVSIGIDPPATSFTVDVPAAAVAVDPPNTGVYIDPPATTFNTEGFNSYHVHSETEPNGAVVRVDFGTQVNVAATGAAGGTTGGALGWHGHTATVDIPAWWADVNIPSFVAEFDIPSFAATVDIAPFASGPLGSGNTIDIRPSRMAVYFLLQAD